MTSKYAHTTRTLPFLVASLILLACAEAPGPTPAVEDASAAPAPDASSPAGAEQSAASQAPAASTAQGDRDGPPLGRYVCRQYTTTMGYLTIAAGGVYETSGVRGQYSYDTASGAMEWHGGSYDEWNWEGRYEHVSRPAGDGRSDEDIIRLEGDGLKIDCYLMSEE